MVSNERRCKGSKKKRGNRRSTHRDHISSLPGDIIHHILSFLKPSQACRTSVLSKRFRSLWRSFPIINLYYPCLEDGFDVSSYKSFLDSTRTCIQNIENGVRIQKFMLRLQFRVEDREDDRVNWLIHYAFSSNGIETVFLYLPYFTAEHVQLPYLVRVPEHAPKTLTSLVLWFCKFDFQELITRCSALKQLRLFACHLLNNTINFSSHKLERLNVKKISFSGSGSVRVEIDAPNLKRLIWKDTMVDYLAFGSCQCLEKVTSSWDIELGEDCFEKSIRKLPSLKILKLHLPKDSKAVSISSSSLTKLHLISHGYWKAVKIKTEQLKDLTLLSSGHSFLYEALDINSACRTLRTLHLDTLRFDYSWVEENLSQFRLLFELKLKCWWWPEKSFLISHESLSRLVLILEAVETEIGIDTPRLQYLSCSYQYCLPLPFKDFIHSNKEFRAMVKFCEKPKLNLKYSRVAAWRFIQSLHDCKRLELDEFSFKVLAFHQEGKYRRLLPFSEIKVTLDSRNYGELLEELILLCCHPKRVIISSFHRGTQSVRFHYVEGVGRKTISVDCESHNVECWRSDLKGVSLVNFVGKQGRLRKFFEQNARLSKTSIQQCTQSN